MCHHLAHFEKSHTFFNLLPALAVKTAMAAFKNPTNVTSIIFIFLLLSFTLTGALSAPDNHAQKSFAIRVPGLQVKDTLQSPELRKEGLWRRLTSYRRMLIGSRGPICTYNECRGCRFKCTAEQVPVDANDPMNSAYHYKCVCHR